ncbi:MAG: glycosyl transferase family 90 [Paracoccus sp. (in: a-proteobacteria)]|uniref:glycosyl transferase family 90 n=1 Tax=Paracoccus sp. TaxID=267 RepID=UPI0026DFDFDE|nr:glycosyl transferase family 90 [Paracoccus sp. (in: a-proteobacteria)]MDO5631803.1 glycosyl transferase family 90 [Paracoccus sp. (in: a-proteobacteria)]
MTARPVFFHIGPDWTGEERLVQMFRLNGHAAACHEEGRLAEDIAFARATGTPPLTRWGGARLFAGLHRINRLERPLIEGWRAFPFIAAQRPEAVFILTTRDPEDWIADRLARRGGAVARAYAHHLNRAVSDLPQIWLRDWHDHLAAVDGFFALGDPRLIRLDLDRETPLDLARHLAPLIDLPRRPPRLHWHPPPAAQDAGTLLALLDQDSPPVLRPSPPPGVGLAEDMAAFCLRGLAPDAAVGSEGVSPLFAQWDGGGRVTRLDGTPWPVAIGPRDRDGAPRAFAQPGHHNKLERVEGVINQILSLGRRDPVRIDMEDGRRIGSDQGRPIGQPALAHNRRSGARNVVLWPLPGFHQPGGATYARPDCPDPIPWEDKQDRAVWRGNISGRVEPVAGRPAGPTSHILLAQLAAADDTARQAMLADLHRIPRFAFVRQHIDSPDFDIGLVLAWSLRQHADDPFLAPLIRPAAGAGYFNRFRYQISMAGYDHPTGFLNAINRQSVLLSEMDGWEVHYSGRFRPWEHYIPLRRGCADVLDKLDWARANPARCRDMSAAARAEVAALSAPWVQARMMGLILDALAALR